MHDVQRPATAIARHHQPATLDDALALMSRLGSSARVVAGGTDLLLELDRGEHAFEELIDITRLEGLGEVTLEPDELTIGALVTHNDVVTSPEIRAHALALAQACLELAAPQLRNRATIVGNVVTASPANDTISALIALDAAAEITSTRGVRIQPIEELITGFRTTTLEGDELITRIRVPRVSSRQTIFAKAGLRRAQAISVVHVAIALTELEDGEISDARVVLGSVAEQVVRSETAERALGGARLDDGVIATAADAARRSVTPIDDVRSTAEHRSALVEIMVRRCLDALAAGAERAAWPDRIPTLGRPRRSSWAGQSHSRDDAVEATVNGRSVRAAQAAGSTALEWLRALPGDERNAALTGAKEGCAEGECGACTIRVDGAAALACLVPAARLHETEVVTVEGLTSDRSLAPIQQAFVDQAAVQCGFCIPGFVMSAACLVDEIDRPTRDEIERALAGNLCRCTGYEAIIGAVRQACGLR